MAVVAVQQLDGTDTDGETKPITRPQWSELTRPCSAHNRLAMLRGSSGKRLVIQKQIKKPVGPPSSEIQRGALDHCESVLFGIMVQFASVGKLAQGWMQKSHPLLNYHITARGTQSYHK